MNTIIRLIGLANGAFATQHDGRFLKAYDPTWVPNDPANADAVTPELALCVKQLESTADWREAMQFESFAEAIRLYRGVSLNWNKRADGKPNRPLTAFTIEVLNIRMLQMRESVEL